MSRSPAIIGPYAKPRNVRGMKIARVSANASMNWSSRARKMGMSGFEMAPMRTHARWIAANSHQLGSWNATTSPLSMPWAASPAPMRRESRSMSR